MEPLVENISDTAKWVAFFRAKESERPDAVFQDPFARKLAGEKGERIATVAKFSRDNSWSFVTRTFLFDHFVAMHVKEGYDTVINLAAGLDARPYRLEVPATLEWIDVDLPAMITYKNKILQDEKPKCQLRSISLDLADRAARLDLFKQLGGEAERALILTEGLLIYLTADDVASLASDLSNQKNFRRWVFDLQSPSLLAMAQENIGSILEGSGAKFQFAPEEGEAYFKRYGWNQVESKSLLPTAFKLNRLPEEFKSYAEQGEPPGPPRPFPWSGVCLLENIALNKEFRLTK
jgi:methyltransferase (TIGR00027 family)